MKKRKALRKEIKRLSRRIAKLENISTVNSFCYGKALTFPEYVKKTEKIISHLADCKKKGG